MENSMWNQVILGDYIFTNKKSISKNYPFEEILYLDTGSITCNIIENLQLFNLKEAPSRAKRLVDINDIIYSTVRPNQLHYGFINEHIENLVVSTGFVTITTKDEYLNSKYLYYFLTQNSTTEYLHSIAEASTSTYPSLKPSDIELLEIQLPPLPEQKSIASVLSSLDDKIDLLHQQNQTLEALAGTLFRQWFIEEAKEYWEEGKLEQLVLSANTGLDAIRRAPIVENYTGIKCLRIQDISQNKTYENWGNTEVKDSDYVKAQLKRGDIIMARTCSPGILLHVQEDLNAVFNNGLARIRANENSHPIFLKYLFKTNEFTNHIYGISDGTAVQLNMKLGDLLSYDFKIPPKNFIERFVEIVSEWNDKILINEQQIQTLTKLRDTLLPKLMSGEVRVKM